MRRVWRCRRCWHGCGGWIARAPRGPDVFVANSRTWPNACSATTDARRRSCIRPWTSIISSSSTHEPADFYFVFGRVVPYKRVDLAVATCARLGRRLLVAGDGRALEGVRAHAPEADVEFLGKVSGAERDRLLGGARALLFPGEEDFGIVPVEAQAAGVPVIAYGVGGAAETVVDGRTGVLFAEQSVAGLAAAIERFEDLALEDRVVRDNARRFGRERFRAEMAA